MAATIVSSLRAGVPADLRYGRCGLRYDPEQLPAKYPEPGEIMPANGGWDEMKESTLACTIKADINEIPTVSLALDQAMRDYGFLDEEILDTQLAVEEAITNVIVHGYAATTGKIVITCRTTRGLAEIQIEDTAPPFNPFSIPEPDITVDIDERKIGGLGVFLIRQVMDDFSYRYEDGKNILVLVKKKTG